MSCPEQNKPLMTLAMIMAASLVGLITGYTVPLISLELSSQGIDAMNVGVLAALPAAGMMISSFVTPLLSRRFMNKQLLSVSLAILVLATLASSLFTEVVVLIIPRFFTGLTSGIIVVLGESWITGSASVRHRAALTGCYTSAFTGCQLMGPLIIAAGAWLQIPALIAICAIAVASLLIINRYPEAIKTENNQNVRWGSLIVFLPVFASGVYCFAFFDASILALFPLYGMAQGLTEKVAILLVTVILLGDALMQVPLGWLADRLGARRVHISCGVLFCIMLLLIPSLFASPSLMIPGCIVLGASAGGLYTLSLVRAGKLFSGQKLITINAIFGLIWSAGSISGPIINGAVINLSSYNSLIAIFLILGLLFIALQMMSREQRK